MAFFNIHQTQEVVNPTDISWIGSVNTGVQIPDGMDSCNMTLEAGTYIVVADGYSNFANGTHQGSITLTADKGELEALGNIDNSSLIITTANANGFFNGHSFSRVYKLVMNEAGTLTFSRNYNSGHTTDKDLLILGVIRVQ